MDPSSKQDDKASGKGKGREDNHEQPPSRKTTEETAASWATRLQDSATGLTRAMVSGRPDASSMSSSSEKAQPNTRLATGSAHTEPGETSRARVSHAPDISSGARFSHTHDAGGQAAASYDSFLANDELPPEVRSDVGSHNFLASSHSDNRPTAIAEQQSRDGAEVLDLLSAPDPPEMMLQDPAVDPDLSPEDIDMLKRALFKDGQPGKGALNWDSLLNFGPDFLLTGDAQGLQQHMGVQDLEQGNVLWLEQWSDVLTNYHDEVWGDLGPLADDARREVQEVQQQPPGTEPSDMKALRRLRQILAQVRGF